jgi:hypothetical protein
MSFLLGTFEVFSDSVIFFADGLWNQARVEILINSGFLGITENLAYPAGESVWNNPSFGVGNSLIILLLAKVFFLDSAQILMALVLLGGIANIGSIFLLSTTLNLSRFYSFAFVVFGSLTPYYFMKFEHFIVGIYFLLPIFIFTLIKFFQQNNTRGTFFFTLAIAAFFSSIWWVIVLLILSVFNLLLVVFNYIVSKEQSLKRLSIFYLGSIMAFLITLLPSIFLLFKSQMYIGESRVAPWQSEIFGGKLSDFFAGSLILEKISPTLIDSLKPGLSVELTYLGLPLMFFSIYLIYKILSYPLGLNRKLPDSHKFLIQFGLISFLFFLLGGLGNLQSTVFNVLSVDPPVRAWSRLSILIALIGLYLFFNTVVTNSEQLWFKLFMSVLLVLSLIESALSPNATYTSMKNSEHYAATKFISSQVASCPILQIPVDTTPVPQDFKNENNGMFYYSNYVPYIIESDLFWSYGSWVQSVGWRYSAAIPSEVSLEWLLNESEVKYCAVLYDRKYADWRGVNAVEWPGLRTAEMVSDYSDERFVVYIIDK